jgi:hypothetical protein
LDEELDEFGIFKWGKEGFVEVPVDYDQVPHNDTKLVGAQQFNRTLQEFVQISKKLQLPESRFIF